MQNKKRKYNRQRSQRPRRKQNKKKDQKQEERDNARKHVNEKPLNDILNQAKLASTEGKNYVNDQFAIHCGKQDLRQAAEIYFGTINHSLSKESTINHTLEQCPHTFVAMDYQVRGTNKGSTFAHSAGVESGKKSNVMMTNNKTVQQILNFAPPPPKHKPTQSRSMVFSFSKTSAIKAVELFNELVTNKDDLKKEIQNVVTQSKH